MVCFGQPTRFIARADSRLSRQRTRGKRVRTGANRSTREGWVENGSRHSRHAARCRQHAACRQRTSTAAATRAQWPSRGARAEMVAFGKLSMRIWVNLPSEMRFLAQFCFLAFFVALFSTCVQGDLQNKALMQSAKHQGSGPVIALTSFTLGDGPLLLCSLIIPVCMVGMQVLYCIQIVPFLKWNVSVAMIHASTTLDQ